MNIRLSSFEDDFRNYLSGLSWLGFSDHSDSYTELDFTLIGKTLHFELELKEKKQPYNMLNWDRVHTPEEHFFVVDDLSTRKVLVAGLNAGLLIRDVVRSKLFFFSTVDLFLMPRMRFNRERQGTPFPKGKWAIDLRHGRECRDFDDAMKVIGEYVASQSDLIKDPVCYGAYAGEMVTTGGTVHSTLYRRQDVAEK